MVETIVLESPTHINQFGIFFNLKYKEMETRKLSKSIPFAEPIKLNLSC